MWIDVPRYRLDSKSHYFFILLLVQKTNNDIRNRKSTTCLTETFYSMTFLGRLLSARNVGTAACVYNSSLLIVNVGFFEAEALADLNPNMFSPFGQLMVLVWGLAYLAVGHAESKDDHDTSKNSSSGRMGTINWIWLVFALEKIPYVLGWIHWRMNNDSNVLLEAAWNEGGGKFSVKLLAPLFHSAYGAGDALFCILFFYLGTARYSQHKANSPENKHD